MIPAPLLPQAVAQAIVAERETCSAFGWITFVFSFQENPHDGCQGAQERFFNIRYRPGR
jgi:hypothetical protein